MIHILMTLLLAAQSAVFIGSGPAAFYSADYDHGTWTWDDIYWTQAGWGHQAGPPRQPGEYWCAHASYDSVGVRLLLVSGGQQFVCVTGDTVRDRDKPSWYAKWGIETSYRLFQTLPDPSHVEVYELGQSPAPSAPESRHFQTTGYSLEGEFLRYWRDAGGVPILGLPLTDRYDCELETGEVGTCQILERARLELHPSGEILLGRLGAEILEERASDG